MVAHRDIQAFADEIAERFAPERIVLFGSYAYGKPTRDSDVDLMVLVKGRNVHDRAVEISLAIDSPFPLDLLVRSTAEFERRIALGDFFLMDIRDKGKVLYEAPHARMGSKGRRRSANRATRAPRPKVA